MITGFGLSKMEQSGVMSTACGTPGYVGESEDGAGGGRLTSWLHSSTWMLLTKKTALRRQRDPSTQQSHVRLRATRSALV